MSNDLPPLQPMGAQSQDTVNLAAALAASMAKDTAQSAGRAAAEAAGCPMRSRIRAGGLAPQRPSSVRPRAGSSAKQLPRFGPPPNMFKRGRLRLLGRTSRKTRSRQS